MPNLAQKQQEKMEKKLVHRLVDGVAGWLTYKQAAGARTLYSEYFLYQPIYEIASGQGWSVRAQEPIANRPKKSGAPSTLDFVFYELPLKDDRNIGIIMMEVKYLRGENTTQELRTLQDDFTKLRAAKSDDLRHTKSPSACGTPGKWQLIVARREAYRKLSACKSKEFSSVIKMLKAASCSKKSSSIYHSTIETKLKSEFHWRVIAIPEKIWPQLPAQNS